MCFQTLKTQLHQQPDAGRPAGLGTKEVTARWNLSISAQYCQQIPGQNPVSSNNHVKNSCSRSLEENKTSLVNIVPLGAIAFHCGALILYVKLRESYPMCMTDTIVLLKDALSRIQVLQIQFWDLLHAINNSLPAFV